MGSKLINGNVEVTGSILLNNVSLEPMVSGETVKTINGQSILGEGNISLENMTNITHSELLALKNNSELVPGMFYRITDYTMAIKALSGGWYHVNNPSLRPYYSDTRYDMTICLYSAGHTFDIIVQALTTSTLSEDAYAAQNANDSYFDNCDLSRWRLKYCLDNDDVRFPIINTSSSKGYIYYMKDEWNNEASFDFKNLLIKKQYKNSTSNPSSSGVVVYTIDRYYAFTKITDNVVYDASLTGTANNNSFIFDYPTSSSNYLSETFVNKLSNTAVGSVSGLRGRNLLISHFDTVSDINAGDGNSLYMKNSNYITIGKNNVLSIQYIDGGYNSNNNFCTFGNNNTGSIRYYDTSGKLHDIHIGNGNKIKINTGYVYSSGLTIGDGNDIDGDVIQSVIGNYNTNIKIYRANYVTIGNFNTYITIGASGWNFNRYINVGDYCNFVSLSPISLNQQDSITYVDLGSYVSGRDNSNRLTILCKHDGERQKFVRSDTVTIEVVGISYTGTSINSSGTSSTDSYVRDRFSNKATAAPCGTSYTSTYNTETSYTLTNITITMGGIDITSSAWDSTTNTISIPDINGDIVITTEKTAVTS